MASWLGSAFGIWRWDGVRQVGLGELDTRVVWLFSILSWTTRLDLLFAHASLMTLTLHHVFSQSNLMRSLGLEDITLENVDPERGASQLCRMLY